MYPNYVPVALAFCLCLSSALVARPWAPEDIARFRTVVKLQHLPAAVVAVANDKERFHFSPDRQYVFFTESWPELESDSNVTQLNLYRAADILAGLGGKALLPLRTVRFRSRQQVGGLAGVSMAQWDQAGEGILFLCDTAPGPMRLCRMDAQTGRVAYLTEESQRLSGDAQFFYRSGTLLWTDRIQDPPRNIAYPVEPLVRADDGSVRTIKDDRPKLQIMYARIGEGPTQQMPMLSQGGITAEVSPQGRHALVILTDVIHEGSSAILRRHVAVLDFEKKIYLSALEREFGVAVPRAFWSSRGDVAVFVGVKSAAARGNDMRDGTKPSEIIVTEMATGSQQALPFDAKDLAGAHWLDGRDAFLVMRNSGNGEVYEKRAGGWISRAAGLDELDKDSASPISIQLLEDANIAPRVIASNGQRKVELTTPGPTLAGIRFARSEIFRWMNSDGKEQAGLLTLPVGFRRGAAVPLVIQVDRDFDAAVSAAQFLPEGQTTGRPYATQSLAAAGIAVLDVGDSSGIGEAGNIAFRAFLKAAVNALATDGIADPQKVGVTGVRSTAAKLENAITHPDDLHIAATVIHNPNVVGVSNFFSYLKHGAVADSRSIEMNNGLWKNYYGGPFWQAKQGWFDKAVIFNIDKIASATLYSKSFGGTAGDPYANFELQEVVGAFRTTHRPLEYLIFEKGDDLLLNLPQERLALSRAVVDWYSFWLKGERPSDPGRAARWSKIKADWDRQQAWEAAGNPAGSTPDPKFQVPETATKH